MKKLVHKENVMGMSNIAGKRVKIDGPLPFSFYFGQHDAGGNIINHGIRIKFNLNPERYNNSDCYILELHGDYKCNNPNIPSKQLNLLRSFFKKYKVIFAGVWEGAIPEDSVTAYFRQLLTLREVIEDCEFYADYQDQLDDVTTIEEFEDVVRHYNIFNMND